MAVVLIIAEFMIMVYFIYLAELFICLEVGWINLGSCLQAERHVKNLAGYGLRLSFRSNIGLYGVFGKSRIV